MVVIEMSEHPEAALIESIARLLVVSDGANPDEVVGDDDRRGWEPYGAAPPTGNLHPWRTIIETSVRHLHTRDAMRFVGLHAELSGR